MTRPEPVPVTLLTGFVQHLLHPPARLAAWPEGDDRRSRLVFILRDLDRSAVENGLRAFVAGAVRPAAG